MGDGPGWIWNLVAEQLPDAIQIVDLYHACQHLWAMVRKLCPNHKGNQKAWMNIHQELLEKGKSKKLVLLLHSIAGLNQSILKFWRRYAPVRGANAILAMRRCYLNHRFEDYWEG